METDVKATEVKITYATMSGDQLETLHAALDKAIASAKGELGRTYPLYIDGKLVASATGGSRPLSGPMRTSPRPVRIPMARRAVPTPGSTTPTCTPTGA